MEKQILKGNYSALLTVLIWGTTFVSTKVLLESFLPIEILFFRFVLGFLALLVISPHFLKVDSLKRELVYAAAGLTGVCLYYLFENIALTYTLAANVSVMVSIAPFFTAILTRLFQKDRESIVFACDFLKNIFRDALVYGSGAQLMSGQKDTAKLLKTKLTRQKLVDLLRVCDTLKKMALMNSNNSILITKICYSLRQAAGR